MFGSDLQITTVKIDIEGEEIKNVRIRGRQDIFEHPTVQEFTENQGGRIVQIEGDLEYEDTGFDFEFGYSDRVGKVMIKKKGSPTGDLDVLEDAFEFVNEVYGEHFIENI